MFVTRFARGTGLWFRSKVVGFRSWIAIHRSLWTSPLRRLPISSRQPSTCTTAGAMDRCYAFGSFDSLNASADWLGDELIGVTGERFKYIMWLIFVICKSLAA